MTMRPPKQSNVDRFQAGTEKVLEGFEEYWLKNKKYLAGDEISVADIFALCELNQLGNLAKCLFGYSCTVDIGIVVFVI